MVWVGDEIPKHLGLNQADIKGLFSIEPASAANSVFPQSVASGDPQPNGITLWTRLACTANSAKVAIEISSDRSFSGPTLRGVTVDTDAQQDYTVKAKITSPELKPFQTYYYRFIYNGTASPPNLQRVHENFAFINIWDDHEFANDCYRVYDTDSANEQQNRAPERRQAASQAWVEYTPASISFDINKDPLTALRIYRSFAFGNLLELVMTDERLYRDGPPCGLETRQRYLTPGCLNRNNPKRTMLGNTQREWFLNKIRNSSRTWKIWGNEVMAMQLKVLSAYASALLGQSVPDLFITLDQWDGYPAERAQIFSSLRQARVKNFVTITGDLHTFVAGYQKVNFDNPADPPVSVCFVVGSITATNFSEQPIVGGTGVPTPSIDQVTQVIQASNPHFKYFNSATHGYNLVEVTPQSLTCTMKAVDTVTQPQANLKTLKVYLVPRDQIQIQEIGS